MDLFTYLMAKNGNNTSVHGDLFSYLLGKAQGGGGQIKTASGITIYIPDATRTGIVSFMMTKESTQDGTPTPDNPVPVNVVEGDRNLLNISNYYVRETRTNVEVNLTTGSLIATDDRNYANKMVWLNISVTNNQSYKINYKNNTFTKIQYTFSEQSLSTWEEVNALTRTDVPSTGIITSSDVNLIIVLTMNNSTLEASIDNLIITEGTQELPYVPYGNNYIAYKQVGKNLFVKSSAIANKYLDVNGNLNDNSVWAVSDYIRVNPSETIYYKGLTATGSAPYSAYYDINKNFISSFKQQTGKRTLTIPNNVYYVRFSVNQSENYPDINTFQVELNPITDYEEGKETTTLIPLNNNEIVGIGDYKDELKVDKSGHVFINKKTGKVVLDGTETFTSMGWAGGKHGFRTTISDIKIITSSSQNSNCISNYYKSYSPSDLFSLAVKNYGVSNRANQSEIIIRNDDCENSTDLQTWLSTNNTEVYYVLETPELIDLNTTVDIELFKGVNNISNSENGYMTIEYR